MLALSQTNYPRLWNLFQIVIGGTYDKRKMMTENVKEGDSVLEIGCSVGNITPAFLDIPNVKYTGLDIDGNALSLARKRFQLDQNCQFVEEDLVVFGQESEDKFDYILFAGMCHHIDTSECVRLISCASKLLSENGAIYIIDPLVPRKEDSLFLRTYMKYLEQGEYLREHEEMIEIFNEVDSLKLGSEKVKFVAPTPFPFYKCTRYGIYKLLPA